MAIRSGRFKVKDAEAGFLLIDGHYGAYYRVFNSGENSFKVNGFAVEVDGSIDVVVTGEVRVTGDKDKEIEGIYDQLERDASVRSGRFRIDANTNTARKIVDLNVSGNAPSAFYRIFNSSKETLVEVYLKNEKKVTLNPGQSVDLEVGKGGNRDVSVKAPAADEPFEGIYEFLGSSST